MAMHSTWLGLLVLWRLAWQLLTWTAGGIVRGGKQVGKLGGLEHWTIHRDHNPTTIHGFFFRSMFRRYSTSARPSLVAKYRPISGLVSTGVTSNAHITRTYDLRVAEPTLRTPTDENFYWCRYRPFYIARAKLFWDPFIQGQQKRNISIIESTKTTWSLQHNFTRHLYHQRLVDERKRSYTIIYSIEFISAFLFTFEQHFSTMDSQTIVYPAGRPLRSIRIVQPHLCNTAELQLYLPRKALDTEITAGQMMNMVEQVLIYSGTTMSNGDKHKLSVGLEKTYKDKIVDASINGGFSTKTTLHLKIRIEAVGVSTNGSLPNTIPFIMRIPVNIKVTTSAIGANDGLNSTGQSTARTITESLKIMGLTYKSGSNTNKAKGKNKSMQERKEDDFRQKQAKQNYLARQGTVDKGTKDINVLTIAGPSIQFVTDRMDPRENLLTSTMTAPKHYVAKLVGFNKDMIQALGDVLDMAQQAFESLLMLLLEDELDMCEDILSRLYYQFHELYHGGEKLESIYVVYLAFNETEIETQRRVTFLDNILSGHYDGDHFVYKKGLKFLIRRYNSHSKEKTSKEVIRARQSVAKVTIQPPFYLTIDSLTTTPTVAMEQIISLFNQVHVVNPRKSCVTSFIEHIGVLTDGSGIYICFTDHLVASEVHRLFQYHPVAMKKLFHPLYGVKQFFDAHGTFTKDVMREEFGLFFQYTGRRLPPAIWTSNVNRFGLKPTVQPTRMASSDISYKSIIASQQIQDHGIGDSEDDLDNSSSSKRMKITESQALVATDSGREVKRDMDIEIDGMKEAAQVSEMTSQATAKLAPTGVVKRKQSSITKHVVTGHGDSMDISEDNEGQEEMVIEEEGALPTLEKFLQSKPAWNKGRNKEYSQKDGKIKIQVKDPLQFHFDKVHPIDPISIIRQDCGIWCMSKLLLLANPLDVTPSWSHDGIIQEDLVFIMQQKDRLENMDDEQQKMLQAKLRKIAISLTTVDGLFGEAITLSLNDALTGDLIIDYLDLQFGLYQKDNGVIELIALKEGLTVHNCCDPEYYTEGYTVLFSKNHMQLVYFEPFRKNLAAIFEQVSQVERERPFPLNDVYDEAIRKRHFGSSGQAKYSKLEEHLKGSKSTNPGKQSKKDIGIRSVFITDEKWEALNRNRIVSSSDTAIPAPIRDDPNSETKRVYITKKQWASILQGRSEDDLGRPITSNTITKLTGAKRPSSPTTKSFNHQSRARIEEIPMPFNAIADIDSDQELDEFNLQNRGRFRVALNNQLAATVGWRGTNNIYQHVSNKLILDLCPAPKSKRIRILLQHVEPIPEQSTVPNDCALWHLKQYFQFMEGLNIKEWQPNPLTVQDLQTLSTRHVKGDGSRDEVDHCFSRSLHKYICSLLHPSKCEAPKITDAPTIQMILRIAKLEYVLYQIDDNTVELFSVQPDMTLEDLTKDSSMHPKHLFLFQPGHVRLVPWDAYRDSLSEIRIDRKFSNIDFYLYHIGQCRLPMTRHIGATHSLDTDNDSDNDSNLDNTEVNNTADNNDAPTQLFPIFSQSTSSTMTTDTGQSQSQANGFTTGQYQRLVKERAVDGKHLPYIWDTPSTTFRRMNIGENGHQATEVKSTHSGRGRSSKRIRRQVRNLNANHELDLLILEYYHQHYGGRSDLYVQDIKELGSGLFTKVALHTTDLIPIVGTIQLTCSAHRLRRKGGINALNDGRGYLVESLQYDVGYGEIAKEKSCRAHNFARCIKLIPMTDPRVNMKLTHTPHGSLILQPTRLILGHPQRPVELFLGHDEITETERDHQPTLPSTMDKKLAPIFRPTGKRRDPKDNRMEQTVLSREEQPGTMDDMGEPDLSPNTPCFGTHSVTDCLKACLNMKGNGTSVPLITEIVKFFRTQNIDVLALIDTGIVSREIAKTVYKKFFGSAHIYIIPAKVPRLCTARKQKAVGGMIIIINEKSTKVERHFKDPSGLGIFHTVRLKVRSHMVDVMFIYWPTTNRDQIAEEALGYQDGLACKLLDYLHQQRIDISPDEWIQQQISKRCPNLDQQDKRYFFLMGDMNRTYNIQEMDKEGTLAKLVTDLGLTTSLKHLLDSKGLGCNSFFRGDIETEIDHAFTNAPMDLISHGGRGLKSRWCSLNYTDHVMIWIGTSLINTMPMPDITAETSLILGALAKIENDNDNTRNLVQKALEDWWDKQAISKLENRQQFFERSSLETLGSVSEQLSRQMSTVVIEALSKPVRRNKSKGLRDSILWSPKLASITAHYESLDEIINILEKPRELGSQIRSCRREIDYWSNKIIKRRRSTHSYDYKPEDEGCTSVLEWMHFLDLASDVINFDAKQRERRNLLHIAKTDKNILGTKIHGRNRKEFANTMAGHISRRESALIDKHLKRAFASLTETQKAAYNFAELSDPDGNVTTDQYEIHDKVSKFFEKIFKNPEDAIPTKLQLEQDNLQSMPLWQRMLEDDEVFQDIFSQSQVPEEIIKIIGSAFSTTDANRAQREQAKAHVLKALEEPFTFDEFHRMIKRARGSSAGGITGLSYGILKLAPVPLLEHLFDLCARMWEHRYIPPYWKVKYLHLLVKDLSKSGLNNLRPIGLIEVLRKIWSNLVIHRVRCAMYESKFLSTAQYGFVSRKGTTDELIQLTNVLEEASESNTHIELTTWDISKAFDSVGRNIQFITWLRMGVPIDVAKWFVDLDNGGYFIVRSPYALHHMRTLNHPTSPAEVMELAQQLGFQAERGYTQGDVLSTTGWVGFFDILLTALEQLPDIGKFFYRSEGLELHAQDSMAYADDLVTVSANREQTDAYAEIICGFMALFGLKLAPDKIRSSTTLSPPGNLTYYDWEWEENQRPFGTADTPITILGVIMSASGSWDAQYEYLLLHCQRITQTVGHKLASLSLKTKLLLCSTLAQILYRTQVIALLPSQLDQLNRVLFKVIRDFKDIGLNFPTQALITKHLGGIFTDVHSATIKRKWSLQGRMLAIGGAQSQAMQSLLSRLHRVGFQDHSPAGQSAFVSPGLVGALPRWGDDLPRSLREGIGLKYFGYRQEVGDPLLSSMVPAPSVECGEVLEELSVYYRSELTPDGNTVPDWLNPRNMPEFKQGVRHLLQSNLVTAPVGESRAEPSCIIAPDQLYTFIGEQYEQTFFEVSGILPSGNIAGRGWKRFGNSKRLVPYRNDDPQGRAYMDIWDLEILPMEHSRRALAYSSRDYDKEKLLLGIHHTLRGQLPPADTLDIPPWCARIIRENAITLGVTSMIVSDASYIRHTETLHSIFRVEQAPPNHAEGAFVLFKPGSFKPTLGILIKGMEDLENYNAYVGELFTGLAAEQLRSCLPGSIESRLDCASVLSATEQMMPASSEYYVNLQEDYGTVLHQFHRLRRHTNHPPIKWTRGHPDRDILRKNGTTDFAIPRREWGQAEYGIYIADHLADFTDLARQSLNSEGIHPETIVEVSIHEILAAIPTRGQWLRCPYNSPNIPILTPQRELADDKIFADYCSQRDQTSVRPARWTIIQPGMLRPTLKILGALGWASKWASYIRVILDKLPHNRNLMKGHSGPYAPCPVCWRGEDSLEHLIRCEGSSIRASRSHFHRLLTADIKSYCDRHDYEDSTIRHSIEYAKALVSTSIPATDSIGGWLGIPTPRFLFFYNSDHEISQKVGKQFRQVLSRIIAESIKWLQAAWRLRCRAAHVSSSQDDSQSTRSNTTTHLTSFHRMARGQNTHRNTASERSSQTSLLPYLVDEVQLTPLDFGLEHDDTSISGTSIENNSERGISLSSLDENILEINTEVTMCEELTTPCIDTGGRPKRFRVTNLRGRLIEGEPLLYDLSNEVAYPEGRTWDDLGANAYYPLYNDIGLLLFSPIQIWIGPSKIQGAGLGLFIFTSFMTLQSGTGVGKYWGPSTRNGGIPIEYAPEEAPVPEGTRDDGDYLLRHGDFLVDADKDCSMGYANEGWCDANCFFQHTSNTDPELLLVLKKTLLPNMIYELTVNYGREYWFSGPIPRILNLGAAARQLCEAFYGG